MTNTTGLQEALNCPQCEGQGKVTHTYKYRPQHRSDTNVENIDRQEICSLCNGAGYISQVVSDDWQVYQAKPVCPVCDGQGGKYFWSWFETEKGTRKQFLFEPCSLCKGARHISLEQLATHNRERRKLRLWGIGCSLIVVVGGLYIATQVVSTLLLHTPWVQCCAPPHVVVITGAIVLSRKSGWFFW